MPYKLIEHAGKYSVENKETGHKFSKGTSLTKAKAQMRLLEGIHYGMKINKKHSK